MTTGTVASRAREMAPRPRLVVVSHGANEPLSPRAQRTRRLIHRLDRGWDVSLLAGPGPRTAKPRKHFLRWVQAGVMDRLAGTVLLDVHEPWSWRRFRRWRPEADLALLVGWPFSPLVAAARRLAQRRIPYVVDVGDPFALTSGATSQLSGIAAWRGARREAEMWRGAAGAVVTTPAQAAALRAHFPELPTLVRPNGYPPEDLPADAFELGARASGEELRLVYFGHFWEHVHAHCRWFFERLVDSGLWRSIVVHQYAGEGTVELPTCLPEGVRFCLHEAVPWKEAIRVSRSYDLALVIGPRNRALLPSKVIDYLTLPIRRLAVVESAETAISTYLAGRRGWLIVDRADEELAWRVAQHASDDVAEGELTPPPEESWPRVTETITAFLGAVLDAARPSLPALSAPTASQPP